MLTGLAKVAGVCNYLDKFIGSGLYCLVFAYHLEILDQIQNYLTKREV